MNAQTNDLRIVQELVEQDDVAVVNQQDYRVAMAFAFGSMTDEQREVFTAHHRPLLAERFSYDYCSSEQVILPLGHLLNAVKYIKSVIPTASFQLLKTDFQFSINMLDEDDDEDDVEQDYICVSV